MIQASSHGLKSTQIPPSSRIIPTAISSVAKEVFTVGFSSSIFLHISLSLSPTIHLREVFGVLYDRLYVERKDT